MFYDEHKTIKTMYGHTKARLFRVIHTVTEQLYFLIYSTR